MEQKESGCSQCDPCQHVVLACSAWLQSVIGLPANGQWNGWGYENFLAEVNEGAGKKFPKWLRKYMNYILPLIIAVVYLKGYYDTFAPMGVKTLVCWMAVAVILLAIIFVTSMKKPVKAKNA